MARENGFAAGSVTFDAKAATETPTSDIGQQRTLKVLASIMNVLIENQGARTQGHLTRTPTSASTRRREITLQGLGVTLHGLCI